VTPHIAFFYLSECIVGYSVENHRCYAAVGLVAVIHRSYPNFLSCLARFLARLMRACGSAPVPYST
jgi:hypothetical protein